MAHAFSQEIASESIQPRLRNTIVPVPVVGSIRKPTVPFADADARFAMSANSYWDLQIRHSNKAEEEIAICCLVVCPYVRYFCNC